MQRWLSQSLSCGSLFTPRSLLLSTPATPSPRRLLCQSCLRPAAACICAAVSAVSLQTEVLILMHPDEVDHAKNTGRLLHLCLPNSRVLTGAQWADQALQDALFGAWDTTPPPDHTVLLYPDTNSCQPPQESRDAGVRLVLIDATWRKSRQMVAAHPLLQALPRLSLQDTPLSRYAIRKAHEPHQLSTLEAARLALVLLEPQNADQITSLDQSMEQFVAFQRKFWPHAQ